MNPAIVIMAKTPQLGLVKTRLQPILSERQCVEIATSFLLDAVRKSFTVTENVFVAFSPADRKKQMKKILSGEIKLILQEGDDLGERMRSAFLSVEKLGFSPIVMIGTDSPTLPAKFIENAVSILSTSETKIVLCRTEDGGYCLIGLKFWKDGLLENVEWSSENTFSDTLKNARKLFGEEPFQLPKWFDIDTPADFADLIKDYSENAKFREIAPHTAAWLDSYGKDLSGKADERIG